MNMLACERHKTQIREQGEHEKEKKKDRSLTGIGQWNGFRVNITEEPSDGGKGDQHERTCRSDDQGVEDSWLLMRGPAKVSERS